MSDNSSLNAYFAKLPDDERRILILRYQVGHSIREIAAIMNLAEAETEARLTAARRRFDAYFDEGSS